MNRTTRSESEATRLRRARDRQRELLEQFDGSSGRSADEPEESLRRYLALLWPSFVLIPLSLAAAAADMQGTTLVIAGGFVVWMLCIAIRERKRSKWFLVPMYLFLLLYMWIMYYLVVVAALSETNPFEGLLRNFM